MKRFIEKLGINNLIILLLCGIIIFVAEYMFLTGDTLHGIFVGLWAPTILGIAILIKLALHDNPNSIVFYFSVFVIIAIIIWTLIIISLYNKFNDDS